MSKSKPFLKWAGNKFQIIERIKLILPPGNRLIEPFLGSAAVFLNTDYKRYVLSDTNKDLINLYLQLKKYHQEFIDYSKQYFTPSHNNLETFLHNRELFNNTTNQQLRAALFLYLNKHSFNGLCRFNSSGKFNVSFGKYIRPYFPATEMQFFAKKAKAAIIKHKDFVQAMQQAKPGDIIYCDPPYVPLSSTANFTSYSSNKFGFAEQQQLADLAKSLSKIGATVIISNHDTSFVRNAYKGAKISSFAVQRFISCKGDGRAKVQEVLAVFKP
jgi:DNA adenine methylase